MAFKWACLVCAYSLVLVIGIAAYRSDGRGLAREMAQQTSTPFEWDFLVVEKNLACVNRRTQQAFLSISGLAPWRKISWPETGTDTNPAPSPSAKPEESDEAMIERLLDEVRAAEAERMVAVARNRGFTIRLADGSNAGEAEVAQRLKSANYGGTVQIDRLLLRLKHGEELESAIRSEMGSRQP